MLVRREIQRKLEQELYSILSETMGYLVHLQAACAKSWSQCSYSRQKAERRKTVCNDFIVVGS